MKARQKRDLENNAARLVEIKEQIRALESQKELIQRFLKDELGEGCHVLGDTVVSIDQSVRSNLDKKALVADIGEKKIALYTSYTPYLSVRTKKIKQERVS